MSLSERHQKLLDERGLDIELLVRLGIESSGRLGDDTIAIPYYREGRLVGTKFRTIAGEKKFSQEKGSEQIFYNWDSLADPLLKDEPIIITEGEIDCWAALQSGFSRVVSVPGGAPGEPLGDKETAKYDFLNSVPEIDEKATIILAVDSDDAGANLRADLALRLGSRRCKWVKYPKGCKDLADALQRFGKKGVVQSIQRAQWIVGDVYRMSEIPQAPEAVAYDSGFPGLGNHWRLRLGDFVVVTGVPGSGKSSFVGDICCRMARKHGWPVCFASFEQEPTLDQRRMLRSWFAGKMQVSMAPEELDRADAWIEQMFSFVVPSIDSDATLAWVMERVAAAVLRFGAKLVVIDPWNELEHDRPDGMSQTEYVGAAIRQLKRFCRKYRVLLVIVAHPAKMQRDKNGKYPIPTLYDISDSANWANKADVGVVIHRQGKEKPTVVRVSKVRFRDQIGEPGDVEALYSWETCTYTMPPAEGASARNPAGEG